MGEGDTHIESCERHAANQGVDVLEFGFFRLQEFPSGGGVVKQIPNFHRAPLRVGRRAHVKEGFGAIRTDLPGVRFAALP